MSNDGNFPAAGQIGQLLEDVVSGIRGGAGHAAAANASDYRLGVEGLGWSAFEVARIHSVERISAPFRHHLWLARSASQGPIDPDAVVGRPASFATATEGRWHLVHGIVGEAELLERTSQLLVYGLTLVPYLERSRYRRRCRNFVDSTLRQIVESVLENRSHDHPNGSGGLAKLTNDPVAPPRFPDFEVFQPAGAFYRWAVASVERLDHAELRSYVVQYNETDLDFVARLLEEEGISYLFEHTADGAVLTLTDRPGHSPLFQEDEAFPLRSDVSIGGGNTTQLILSLGTRSALRPDRITMRDFSWPRSRTLLEATRGTEDSVVPASSWFEFPARDEALADSPCDFPARIRHERFEVERRTSEGHSTVRSLRPGYRFRLLDDHGHGDRELLTVAVETFAKQFELPGTDLAAEPFGPGRREIGVGEHRNRFLAVPAELRFRPAISTSKPRIDGIQTALVTAEEFPQGSRPEINADAYARVRLRFPWDQTPDDGTPTSSWVRVSQGWAGAAYGGLMHPRVGHEVLVAYLQGDPDRPYVVGRVYNAQTPPPYDGSQEPEKSTIRTQSTPGGNGFNELRFDDRAGDEEIFIHAQRDFNEVIEHDHRVRVGHDEGHEIGRHQSTEVRGNQSTTVSRSRAVRVGGSQNNAIGGGHSHSVGGDQSISVGGNREVTIHEGDKLTIEEGDGIVEITTGNYKVTVHPGILTLKAGLTEIEMTENRMELKSGQGASLKVGGNVIILEAMGIYLRSGREIFANAANNIELGAQRILADGATITSIEGGEVRINCGVSTGLGDDVDDIVNASPTLSAQIAELQEEGWDIRYGTPGGGSECDRDARQITIDGNRRDNPEQAAQTLAHEVGHALYQPEPYVPPNGRTREQYVSDNANRHLRDEGAATLNNARVRDELGTTTGRDIGLAGTQSDRYDQIYQDRRAGNITEHQARDQIGQTFADHETTSTTHEPYRDYYRRPYEDHWDEAHGKGNHAG